MAIIYLDNAATTPIHASVVEVMSNSMLSVYGNPSSTHQFGRKAKSVVENSRKNIAKHFNVSSSEIVFTAGGSEADNLILRNAITNLDVKRIITTKIEHHAVLHTVESLVKEFDVVLEFVDLASNGNIDYDHLSRLLESSELKTLVSLMYINNEIGNVLDVNRVGKLCSANKALFHSDTVQAIGHYNLDLGKLPIDFAVASAHKFHGPKGVGFAYFKKGIGINSLIKGGEQERGARAGTENVHSILGMEKALDLAMNTLTEDQTYIEGLKTYFINQLKAEIPKVKFNGTAKDTSNNSYTILNVLFPFESKMALFTLDLKGIGVSGGSACQSGSNKGSHVLNTILSEEDAIKTSIRFSFSKLNTKVEIDEVIEELRKLFNPV